MQLVKAVALRAQTALKAAFGSKSTYADYDYIINFVAIVNDDITNRFQSLGLNFDTQVVVLTAVPANTTDLSAYQADGRVLQNLIIPESTDGSSPLEWRVTGQSDLSWQPVPWVGKVADTNTAPSGSPVASESAAVDSFEWRAGIIYISPCNQIVDLRVRGSFVPALADNDAAPFIRGMINVLVYWTCEMISALAPGGEAGPSYKWFADHAKIAEVDFVTNLAKAQLSIPVRLGGRRTNWPGPIGSFSPPIVN